MLAVAVIGLVVLFCGVIGVCGNLDRIAKAVEAQNRHYGIGVQPEPDKAEA